LIEFDHGATSLPTISSVDIIASSASTGEMRIEWEGSGLCNPIPLDWGGVVHHKICC